MLSGIDSNSGPIGCATDPIVKEIPEVVSSSHDAAHAVPTLVNECVAPARDVVHATRAPEVHALQDNVLIGPGIFSYIDHVGSNFNL